MQLVSPLTMSSIGFHIHQRLTPVMVRLYSPLVREWFTLSLISTISTHDINKDKPSQTTLFLIIEILRGHKLCTLVKR